MQQLKLVPWFNRNEFIEVYDLIFSRDVAKWKMAIQHLQCWKSRLQSQSPVAIECTATLLEAHILMLQSSDQLDKDGLLRTSCGMALVRFMNLIAGRFRGFRGVSMATRAYSMYDEAKMIGLDDWLVDQRHKITHKEMPSLTMIRDGIASALTWIKREFWERQMTSMNDQKIAPQRRDNKLDRLLTAYHRLSKPKNLRHVERDQSELNEIIREMTAYRFDLCYYLVQSDCLIVTSDQIRKWRTSHHDIHHALISAHFPAKIWRHWRELINALHRDRLTASLLRQLLELVSCQPSDRNLFIAGWCHVIICLFADDKEGDETKSIPWDTVFRLLVDSPNSFTEKSLIRVFPLMSTQLSINEQRAVLDLVRSFVEPMNDVSTSGAKDCHMYTEADVPEQTEIKSPWQFCEESGWESCPLGSLPSQRVNSFVLRTASTRSQDPLIHYADTEMDESNAYIGHDSEMDTQVEHSYEGEDLTVWYSSQIDEIRSRVTLLKN